MVTLLAQLYQRENRRRWAPDLLAAIMIHTATDVFHVGPDYRFGWGNADAKAAADFIIADAAMPGQRLARGAVRDTELAEYPMDIPAGTPALKVLQAGPEPIELRIDHLGMVPGRGIAPKRLARESQRCCGTSQLVLGAGDKLRIPHTASVSL